MVRWHSLTVRASNRLMSAEVDRERVLLVRNNQGAIEDYNRAIEIDPSLAKSESVRAAISIDSYNNAVTRNPKDAGAYFRRARAKDEFNDKKGAIEDYNQAIALDPKFAEAYYHRANTKEQLGDIQGAIADFDRSSTLNPSHTPTYIRRENEKLPVAHGTLWLDNLS
ncbi:MAG: tetratricopeptide repeat protein [Chamaesiphon sp. CSU_1_12]|nr:tetratricopeptide repeat protein [Chamaesiphon sp. CSU_1_12]